MWRGGVGDGGVLSSTSPGEVPGSGPTGTRTVWVVVLPDSCRPYFQPTRWALTFDPVDLQTPEECFPYTRPSRPVPPSLRLSERWGNRPVGRFRVNDRLGRKGAPRRPEGVLLETLVGVWTSGSEWDPFAGRGISSWGRVVHGRVRGRVFRRISGPSGTEEIRAEKGTGRSTSVLWSVHLVSPESYSDEITFDKTVVKGLTE